MGKITCRPWGKNYFLEGKIFTIFVGFKFNSALYILLDLNLKLDMSLLGSRHLYSFFFRSVGILGFKLIKRVLFIILILPFT